ncbi:MAG: transporter substrate-binding domain-containing protein [Myxococcota bacterium]
MQGSSLRGRLGALVTPPAPHRALRLPRLLACALLLVLALDVAGCRSTDAAGGGVLRVGVAPSHPPVVFEQDGELMGIEIDLAQALGAQLRRRVAFVRIDESQPLAALERGEVDVVMSGLSITPEREDRVLFAAPYMRAGQLALIRSADIGRFGRVHTLRRPGARVGFEYGTAGERFVATELTRASSFGFEDVAEGIRSLRAGRIDFFIHDAPTIWRLAGDPAQRDLHGLYQLLTHEEIAWAVRRGDGALKTRLDAAVAAWQQDGQIERIVDRWIPVRVTVR